MLVLLSDLAYEQHAKKKKNVMPCQLCSLY